MCPQTFIENLLPISGAVLLLLLLLLAKFMQEVYIAETFHCSEKYDLRDSASELYSGGFGLVVGLDIDILFWVVIGSSVHSGN